MEDYNFILICFLLIILSNSLLEMRHFSNQQYYQLSIENLSPKQKLKIKKPIIDANNRLNSIFKSFDLFNHKFSPGNRLVDLFSSRFSFFLLNRKSVKSRKSYLHKLNEVVFNASTDPKSAVIVLDTNIKNSITTSILYMHTYNLLVIKNIQYYKHYFHWS